MSSMQFAWIIIWKANALIKPFLLFLNLFCWKWQWIKAKGFASFSLFHATRYVCKALAYRARASYESALTSPTIASSSNGAGCVEGAYRAATPRRSVAALPPYQALHILHPDSRVVCIFGRGGYLAREFSRARQEQGPDQVCIAIQRVASVFQSRGHYTHPPPDLRSLTSSSSSSFNFIAVGIAFRLGHFTTIRNKISALRVCH